MKDHHVRVFKVILTSENATSGLRIRISEVGVFYKSDS